jgi:hypothetical protein
VEVKHGGWRWRWELEERMVKLFFRVHSWRSSSPSVINAPHSALHGVLTPHFFFLQGVVPMQMIFGHSATLRADGDPSGVVPVLWTAAIHLDLVKVAAEQKDLITFSFF